MSKHSGMTKSIWMADSLSDAGPLDRNISADVCIVGAGIAGLSVAYQLSRERKKVVVLDDGPPGAGETERTTAHLSYALDDRYFVLEKLHGLEKARLAIRSHLAAINEIEAVVARENIQCDFARLNGYLFPPPEGSREKLQEDLDTASRIGLEQVHMVARAPLESFNTGPCLVFPGNGQFHPLKYLAGIRSAIEKNGGKLFCNTRATGFKGGVPAQVTTESGFEVSCGAIVVATNSPVNDRLKIHSKQAAYRTYVVGFRIPRGSVPPGLYWDTAQDAQSEESEPMSAAYHYVRLQASPAEPGEEILIVGGEDHKTGQADDGEARWDRLEKWTRERFLVTQVASRWSGQVMEPMDGLAYIGRNPGDEHNVFIATGDSGHGITHGTIAGMLIRDLIVSRPNAWEMVYDPSRKTPASGLVYARENANVAAKYGEHFTGGEVRSLEEIQPGSGAVMRRGIHKRAIYRSVDGQITELSAVCPHLKCIVHWNTAEKSWDCPCHGSRFTPYGDILNGPTLGGLKHVEENAEQREAA